MYDVQAYISYIQKLEWGYAPKKPITYLIFPEDFPKKEPMKAVDIKYIPDDVWEQILDNLNYLNPYYMPILMVLESSGFRISDTLLLKKNCIEKTIDGWWLIGDQRKVDYTNHRVPITDEIAYVVKAQIQFLDNIGDSSFNPKQYLFPNLTGRRKNYSISAKVFNDNLNYLVQNRQIRDRSGKIYHIKNHAFRHRYGVTMINNGMNILHLQKLMAHASPEMTLIYAQIHDNTLRQEWEKARFKGAVRLSSEGKIIEVDIEAQAKENGIELEWIRHNLDSIRLDHGFCVKSPKLSCDFLEQTLEPPCIKNNCRSFHTDYTFLDYYNDQINKIETDIKIYKKTNRLRSIELIQPKLKRYKEIALSLENGEGIYGLNKGRREYTNDERRKVYNRGKPTT
ncbi:tyrosine-type recombinase/integrase [Bacillus vallismortis]|nr:tyrosine-type recombinase/integrase [Bacillus vallismortis]